MWQSLSLPSSLAQLCQHLEGGHRALVSLTGELAWALQQSGALFDWASLNVCKYSSANQALSDDVILPSVAYQYLGRQIDGLFMDLSEGLKPDALAALAGCVRGGGLLCVYWGMCTDAHPAETHLELAGEPKGKTGHRLRERVLGYAMQGHHYVLDERSDALDLSSSNGPVVPHVELTWTQDQLRALEAVEKVTMGRRRRPLIIEAPRGRGKSTVLAEALIRTLQKKAGHVLVVMPHAFSALPLLSRLEDHWSRGLTFGVRHDLGDSKALTLLTMEQALSGEHLGDVIFVDEAACFPVHVLNGFVAQTSRIVFSTTTAGYEGTGQGFRLRFDAQLKARYPERRRVEMDIPVRWRVGDPVESWLNQSLCLTPDLSNTPIGTDRVHVERVSSDTLVGQIGLLEAVYGLLVRAHHRTTPSDLQRIIDGPNMNIWVARNSTEILGVCVVAEEGSLSPELVEPVYRGERRPRGHFLPETLSVHVGLKHSILLRYWRIVRIAVAAGSRRAGIGQALLDMVESQAKVRGVDILGASFGATGPLLLFWQHARYRVVRMGVKRGRSSGLFSAVVLKSVSDTDDGVVDEARYRYTRYFPNCLSEGLLQLEWPVARRLFQELEVHEVAQGDELDLINLDAFVAGRQSFEVVSPSVKRALRSILCKQVSDRILDAHWAFVIQKVFQHRPWRQMKFDGRVLDSRGLAHTQLRMSVEQFVSV